MEKGITFMNNKSILFAGCLESVDFRLNFYLILLSDYVLVHVFSSITEISLRYILETKTGEGRIAVVCMQPVAVAHCLKIALFENNILWTYFENNFLWREFQNFLVWLFTVRKALFGLNFRCLKTEKRDPITEIFYGVGIVSVESMASMHLQYSSENVV